MLCGQVMIMSALVTSPSLTSGLHFGLHIGLHAPGWGEVGNGVRGSGEGEDRREGAAPGEIDFF